MKTNNMLNELAIRLHVKRFVLQMLYGSLILNLILGFALATSKTIVMNTLTPPEIRRSLTVSNIGLSKEYLEEMAPYHAHLLLNATPQNVDFRVDQLLKYAAPEYHNALEKESRINALWIKRNNLSTYFTPTSAAADVNDNTVLLQGLFEVKKNDNIVDSKTRQFVIAYNNNHGTLELLSIKEILPENLTPADEASQRKFELNNPAQPEAKSETVEITNKIKDFKGGSDAIK